ncbi:MAG: histidine phosphatase family protein [Anaerolineae bacterium]|nr:histidine phosphatase family protein [Anaerolineae bacterium]MDQ7037011.1 histidine phosphatase family protein [Anaerolineae bacterium]
MPNLILIRHSQTKQQPDVDSHLWQLTEEGRKRCQTLAEALRPYAIDRIITSEEAKAYLTGQLIADVLEIDCETAPNLHETRRETVPYFENIADFRAAVQAAMLQPDKMLFGEEAFTGALNRFSQQIDSLLEQYPDDRLAIVTHGTVMSLYLAHLSGQNVVTLWNSLDMPAYAVLSLPQKTITKIFTSITQGNNDDSQSKRK